MDTMASENDMATPKMVAKLVDLALGATEEEWVSGRHSHPKEWQGVHMTQKKEENLAEVVEVLATQGVLATVSHESLQ